MKILIVAGEASGDKHGAHLVESLRSLRPDIQFEFFGIGGSEMRAATVDTIIDSRDLAIMGAIEVAKALPKFLRIFRRIRDAAAERKPDVVILIDWPEFNLRLAKKLKLDGNKIIYYISPQLWAWRSYRINIVKKYIDKMLVILPFEKEYYERHGVEVDYVGHPLLDSVQVTKGKIEFCSSNKLDPLRPIISLLPGSRHSEVKYILPPLIDTVRLLNDSHPEYQFILPLAKTVLRDELATDIPDNLTIIQYDTYNAIAASDLAVVASGTATLETAIIGTPLIIVYKASKLNWHIFRPLINVPFVGMPNLIAGHEVAPEILQYDLNPLRLSAVIVEMMSNKDRLHQAREDMKDVRRRLGDANATERASQVIIDFLTLDLK